jgi:hypothetical protein
MHQHYIQRERERERERETERQREGERNRDTERERERDKERERANARRTFSTRKAVMPCALASGTVFAYTTSTSASGPLVIQNLLPDRR